MNQHCPKCNTSIDTVNVNAITIKGSGTNFYRGVSFVCEHCNTIISVQIDPLTLHSEVLEAIQKS